MTLTRDQKAAYLNGKEVALGAKVAVVNNHMMVPLIFFSEALGASVQWVPRTNTAMIETAMADMGEI